MVKHGVTFFFFLHDFIGKLHGEPAEGADEGSEQSVSWLELTAVTYGGLNV